MEIAFLIHNGTVIKGDAVPLIDFYQRGVQSALVLFAQVLFLQRKPDDELRDLIGQHRVVTGGNVLELGIGVQRFSPNGHEVGTVLRRW